MCNKTEGEDQHWEEKSGGSCRDGVLVFRCICEHVFSRSCKEGLGPLTMQRKKECERQRPGEAPHWSSHFPYVLYFESSAGLNWRFIKEHTAASTRFYIQSCWAPLESHISNQLPADPWALSAVAAFFLCTTGTWLRSTHLPKCPWQEKMGGQRREETRRRNEPE